MTIKHTAGGTRYEQHGTPRPRNELPKKVAFHNGRRVQVLGFNQYAPIALVKYGDGMSAHIAISELEFEVFNPFALEDDCDEDD